MPKYVLKETSTQTGFGLGILDRISSFTENVRMSIVNRWTPQVNVQKKYLR